LEGRPNDTEAELGIRGAPSPSPAAGALARPTARKPSERGRAKRRRPWGRTVLGTDGREGHPDRARVPGRTQRRNALAGDLGCTRAPRRTPRVRSRTRRHPPLDRAASFRLEYAVDRSETFIQAGRPLHEIGFW